MAFSGGRALWCKVLSVLLVTTIVTMPFWGCGENQEAEEDETGEVDGNADALGGDGASMVMIRAGEFQMGAHHGGLFDDDAKPVHTVYLDAFYIDKYEVTNAQFAKFLNEYGENTDATGHRLLEIGLGGGQYCLIELEGGIYKPKSGYENHPAIAVSWYGASAYAQFYDKRLPTEAEWEKAARGGLEGKAYPWGGNFGDIIHDNANCHGTEGRDKWEDTSPIGSFPPNEYGLYDMAGNVWEMCADWYDKNYYSVSPRENPTGPISGAFRVLRGGSWFSSLNSFGVAHRATCNPVEGTGSSGSRCVKDTGS